MMNINTSGPEPLFTTNNEKVETMYIDPSRSEPLSTNDKKVRTSSYADSYFASFRFPPYSPIPKKAKVITVPSKQVMKYLCALDEFKVISTEDDELDDHEKLLYEQYAKENPMRWCRKIPVSAKRRVSLEEMSWLEPIYCPPTDSRGSQTLRSLPEFGCQTQRSLPEFSCDDEYYTGKGARYPKEKGATILAFIFREGIMVAVDRSDAHIEDVPASKLAVENIIEFNPCAIGCITGEIAGIELFHSELLQKGINGSIEDVSKCVAGALSSCNVKGVSGVLIAGWEETGPSLYRIAGKGKRFKGESFACGSCSQYAIGTLAFKNHYYMSFHEAAKFARVAIRLAVAQSNNLSGDEASDDEDGETSERDGCVSVYYVGSHGWSEVYEDIGEAGTEDKTDTVAP